MHHALIFNVHNLALRRPSGGYRIASFLREHDWDVEVVDYLESWQLDELKEFVRSRVNNNTVFFGFSCFFYNWHNHLNDLIDWTKKEYPHIKMVVGGQSKKIMQTKNIDYYVQGYGEYAILELVKSIIGNTSKGLNFDPLYFGSKRVITANHSYPAFPLKSLRIKYEDRDDLQPWEWLTVEFARGCIFKCPYCNFPVLGVREDHTRSAEDFEIEMRENWERWGIKNYYVADETFNDYTEKIVKYANVVEKINFNPIFSGFIRADLLVARSEDWDPMIKIGFFGHFYGIETMNYQSAKVIGKGMDPSKLQQGLIDIKKYFSDRGPYRGAMGIVVGLPYETIESQMKTFKWIDDHWQGEAAHVWPLEIPIDPAEDVLSVLSKEYQKYGYRPSDKMPQQIPQELFSFGHSESRIKHINSTLIWENDNMSYADACKIADDWNLAVYKREKNVGISMFTFGDYSYPDLNLEEMLKIKHLWDWPDNRTGPREREYIERKLNRK